MKSNLIHLFLTLPFISFSQNHHRPISPGEIVTIDWQRSGSIIDGYTLYVPEKHQDAKQKFTPILFLQGGSAVGDAIDVMNGWRIP